MGLFSFNSKRKNNSTNDKHEKINIMSWLRRNSLTRNEDMVKKTFKHFNISEECYQLVANGYGDYDILVQISISQYKIQIDEENMCYNLLKQNCSNNLKKKERYHYIDSYYGDDLLFDILKHIKSKDIINN